MKRAVIMVSLILMLAMPAIESTSAQGRQGQLEATGNVNSGLTVGILAAALVITGLAGYFLLRRKD